MKGIKILLAALIWISGRCYMPDEGAVHRVTNQRMTTTEGISQETETEEDIDAETEWESESQLDSEIETEWEPVPQICVTDIWPAYEEGYKIYDGSDYVELEADVTGLLEGMHLKLWGIAERADAGVWKVDIQTQLQMEYEGDIPECEILMDEPELSITILPRPLTITISDGVKDYYTEPDLADVEFLSEKGPLQITGFVNDRIPPGFVMPELMWNTDAVQKESPMYRNGERIEYKDAIIVKTDAEGRPVGNATENYCFVLDKDSGYYETGSIFLREPEVVGNRDYQIQAVPQSGLFQNEQGTIWVRKGTMLQIKPEKGNGFNQGTGTQNLTESGTAALQLIKVDKQGQVIAGSYPQYLSYQVDAQAPQARIGVAGIPSETADTIYQKEPVTCGIIELQEAGSGIRSIQICAIAEQNQRMESPEEIYESNPQIWQSGIQIQLSAEGCYTVLARLEDQVGNVQFVRSGQIVLDWTPPELEIQDILPGSANNDRVAPRIFCQDEYYQENSLSVVLTGSKIGEKRFSQIRTDQVYGEHIQIQDIPREKRWDDLYVLQATASDMAGNQAEKKIAFSVNRFGSVYQLDGKTREKLDRYYMKEPMELVVWEFNVDTVLAEKIRVGHKMQVRQLTEGTQYRVKQREDEKGWKEYCYRISAENFVEEGVYYVVLTSADRADNVTDSQSQKVKMEFAVDRTAPVILISGVEDGKQYEEEKRVVIIDCQDNQKLENIQIYLNGELVAENRETQQKLEISASESWQRLEVKATDGAGNTGILEPVTFYLGKNAQQPEFHEGSSATEPSKPEELKPKPQSEKIISETKETEISTAPKTEKNSIQVILFLVISGILGGYLHKIKKAKE